MSNSMNQTSKSIAPNSARAEAAQSLPPYAPLVLRLPAVEALTGLRKTSIYDMMREGEFPRPVPLGPRARGWLAAEVQGWIEQRAALRA